MRPPTCGSTPEHLGCDSSRRRSTRIRPPSTTSSMQTRKATRAGHHFLRVPRRWAGLRGGRSGSPGRCSVSDRTRRSISGRSDSNRKASTRIAATDGCVFPIRKACRSSSGWSRTTTDPSRLAIRRSQKTTPSRASTACAVFERSVAQRGFTLDDAQHGTDRNQRVDGAR